MKVNNDNPQNKSQKAQENATPPFYRTFESIPVGCGFASVKSQSRQPKDHSWKLEQ
jgi:hypothetical protein